MKEIHIKLLFIIFLFISINSNAQLITKEKKDSLVSKVVRVNDKMYKIMQVIPAPIISYSSETNWVFGLAKFQGYNIKKSDTISRASSVSATFAASLDGQMYGVFSNSSYFGENKNILNTFFDYEKYPREWYVINSSDQNKDYSELVTTNFISTYVEYLRQFVPKTYIGLAYHYDNYFKIDYPKGGLLDSVDFFGKEGGINSGLGLIVQYDSRDNTFSTYSGLYLNVEGHHYSELIGSDYNFNKYIIDFRAFTQKKGFVIGGQIYSESNFGEIPFYNMAQLGGSYRMRGFYSGQIRNKILVDSQVEIRKHLFWLVSGAAYMGVGSVSKDYPINTMLNVLVDKMVYSYGAGFRLTVDPENRINIRFDFGLGYDQYLNRYYRALFFGFSEAF